MRGAERAASRSLSLVDEPGCRHRRRPGAAHLHTLGLLLFPTLQVWRAFTSTSSTTWAAAATRPSVRSGLP